MKLSIFCVSFLLTLILNEGYCRCAQPLSSHSWTDSIINTITSKTSQVKQYVVQKGRSLKNWYDNAKDYIIGSDDEEDVLSKEFSKHLENAANGQKQVFDSIAPQINKESLECLQDDPAVRMTTPQLIALHGYKAESHTILTDDGYILTVHRIPLPKNASTTIVSRKTVLLHHGILGSSADWVIAGANKGLAYYLSDAGYDVWMANVRGNTYSRAHVSRSIDSYEFWNFSFHDVSQHDLPAVVDYIMNLKGSNAKINYVGHSMGTTILFAMLSTKPHYNKVLRAGFALAPVAYMSDIKSPIRLLAKFSNNIEFLMKILGANEFLPQNSFMRWLAKHACEITRYEEAICENSLFIICGHDESQFNKTLLPLILGHMPAGASTKTLVHYAQEIKNNGRFQQFNYGKEGNLKQYGTETPPEYPVHNITLPIALLSAENDWLASEIDVKHLYLMLPNPIEHYVVPLTQFNHNDFLWAIDAPKLVYKKLLQMMEQNVSGNI